MGSVYRARDMHFPNVTKLVAVKEMINSAPDPLVRETIVQNFEREANLPKASIVVVSQVSTVEKAQLGEYIGTLSKQRIDQILAGMRFIQHMIEHRG